MVNQLVPVGLSISDAIRRYLTVGASFSYVLRGHDSSIRRYPTPVPVTPGHPRYPASPSSSGVKLKMESGMVRGEYVRPSMFKKYAK